jgi:hypothetical protein
MRSTSPRLRRIVAPLVVAAGALCVTVPATAAAAAPAAPAHERASASGIVIPPFIKNLVQRGFHRGKPVLKYVAKRTLRTWTKDQAVEWFCESWDRYFGYDVNRWWYAAQYNWSAYWAWRYCASNGY